MWQKASIEDCVTEGRRLNHTVNYEHLCNENPAPITAAYGHPSDPIIELPLLTPQRLSAVRPKD
jgi:hypothetical protein